MLGIMILMRSDNLLVLNWVKNSINNIGIISRLAIFTTLLSSLASISYVQPASAESYISQGYYTDSSLSLGSIVSLKVNTTDSVEAGSINNVEGLFGVVINAGSSPITLSSSSGNQVQVGTTGTLPVLVSDMNGAVVLGDHITASPISGVGMKATGNVKVVGIAQSDLGANGSKSQTYTDNDGVKKSVLIGEVPVLVNVAYYFKEPDKTLIPSVLQNLANTIAGKNVNSLPILISAGIFIVTLIVVVSIVYAMIHSSIISVGRNPMSQSAIYRDLIQLSALVLGILAVAVIAIFLVLTRL
jgi:hypothetical protein